MEMAVVECHQCHARFHAFDWESALRKCKHHTCTHLWTKQKLGRILNRAMGKNNNGKGVVNRPNLV